MQSFNLKNYQIILGDDEIWGVVRNILTRGTPYSKVMILVDENTKQDCLPKFLEQVDYKDFEVIEIKSGEEHKTIETCVKIWQAMGKCGADRKSALFNLGGGVIGDMGGFCAGTFKRGIDFYQIPTTLLSQVDASVGGKLGIDFEGIKNNVGLFLDPKAVYIYPPFLKSLPERELRSGFAEIIKHALIADYGMWEQMQAIKKLKQVNWRALIPPSLRIKQRIVEQDPYEKGIRKILNFGHTIGHAVESYSHSSQLPLRHGEAIAVGMICEAYLSNKTFVLPRVAVRRITAFILHHFDKYPFPKDAVEDMIYIMKQDKKNVGGSINFSLLKEEGVAVYDQTCTEDLIREALLYYCDLL